MTPTPIHEAQARLLALATPLPIEAAKLDQARGRYLAEPLTARRDQPWRDLSAMDGYAIRFADLPGPWRLTGEIAAGALPPQAPLAPGTTMRIFTGAPLPSGADTVVMQEDVTAQGEIIYLTGDGPATAGRHVRARASDFGQGGALLTTGMALGPAQIALAALAGHAALPVRRRPNVAILSTGDELTLPGAPCPPGTLPASNGVMLAAMIEQAGGAVISDQLIGDDLPTLIAALSAAQSADIIITSGGASVGDHDLVRPALEAAGGTIDFWKIAMRPGKPLIVGTLGDALFLGLPGNPVSAMVTAALFLVPLLRHLAGAHDPLPRRQSASLGAPMDAVGGRTSLVRATLADGVVTPLPDQDSAAMRAAASANALIERPAHAPAAAPGDLVPVFSFAQLGLA